MAKSNTTLINGLKHLGAVVYDSLGNKFTCIGVVLDGVPCLVFSSDIGSVEHEPLSRFRPDMIL